MAIRVPNLGLGDGKTGDTELKIRQDYNHNFSDQTHAASRLVGKEAGNVMEVGAFGIGRSGTTYQVAETTITGLIDNLSAKGSHFFRNTGTNLATHPYGGGIFALTSDTYLGITANYQNSEITAFSGVTSNSANTQIMKLWHDKNATKDANGFLKGASPVIDMYDNKIDLNHDAEQQGGITFEKLGIGDYLIKGSLGFAQEGWYIETPKDANGNVLVAVVYEQLANNDLSIKTYAKKFDDETGDIVANLLKPRDIPAGRFISLRLHELPKEPPVMPNESQPEV